MLPFPIVEDLDVFKSGGLDLSVRNVANAMHPFILEAVRENPFSKSKMTSGWISSAYGDESPPNRWLQ